LFWAADVVRSIWLVRCAFASRYHCENQSALVMSEALRGLTVWRPQGERHQALQHQHDRRGLKALKAKERASRVSY
jgi:hypothetical protein